MMCENCRQEFTGAVCPECNKQAKNIQTAEVITETTLEITRTEQTALPAIIEKKPHFLARAAKLMNTPVGRKVAKGVALVAVGVGMELLTQAAVKNSRQERKLALPKKESGKQPHLIAQVRQNNPQVPEKVIQFFAPPEGTTVIETFYYKEVTIRRETKW
jgi:hypothetical protein